ncbi:MAG: peroxidase-related enzyme [Saprospiraceae bacterium]|nr:peroxidase-related enzyme [Saprospiraceae bacterium]
MPFIRTISYKESAGYLKHIYDDLIKKRGKLADVHKIQSLNPESIVAHMDLYMCVMFGKSPLRRYQREMMAVVVSRCNNCTYCVGHHAAALMHFWKDSEKVSQLAKDYRLVKLTDLDMWLCRLADILTVHPDQTEESEILIALRKIGLDDKGILDATLVIAYFNFVNRIVLGLAVEQEEDVGGYKYD